MEENGYQVKKNTKGEDLNNDKRLNANQLILFFTAAEYFEHLLNPYTVLENINCK
jgi:hypothetical protein